MVTRHQVDGDAGVSYLHQGLKGFVDNPGRDLAPEEKVSPVNEQVRFLGPGDIQDVMVIGEEIVTATAPLDPGVQGQVKPKVCIGEEEDFEECFIANGHELYELREFEVSSLVVFSQSL